MTHKEFNDCLKFNNWVESCDRSHDKFNSIDKVSWRHYIIYLHTLKSCLLPQLFILITTISKFQDKRNLVYQPVYEFRLFCTVRLLATTYPSFYFSHAVFFYCILWHFCNFAPGTSFSFDFTAKKGKLAFILTAYDRNFHTAREAS